MSEHLEVSALKVRMCRPIPFGLLKVVAALCLCVLVGYLAMHLQIFAKPQHAGMSGVGVMFVLALGWALVARKSLGSIGDRNLNGYSLWVWLDDKFAKHWELVLGYGLGERTPEGMDLIRTRVALRLGLKGGSDDVFIKEHGKLVRSKYWRVELVWMNDSNGIVIVRLRDRVGGCVELFADDVLRLLDDHVVWPRELQDIPPEQWTRPQKTFQTTVSGLMNWFLISDGVNTDAVAKAKELEKEVGELRMAKNELLETIITAIEKIKQSSRWRRSMEARTIRKQLLDMARGHLPPFDARFIGLCADFQKICDDENREATAAKARSGARS